MVVYPSVYNVFYIQTVVGNGISEPSTVWLKQPKSSPDVSTHPSLCVAMIQPKTGRAPVLSAHSGTTSYPQGRNPAKLKWVRTSYR